MMVKLSTALVLLLADAAFPPVVNADVYSSLGLRGGGGGLSSKGKNIVALDEPAMDDCDKLYKDEKSCVASIDIQCKWCVSAATPTPHCLTPDIASNLPEGVWKCSSSGSDVDVDVNDNDNDNHNDKDKPDLDFHCYKLGTNENSCKSDTTCAWCKPSEQFKDELKDVCFPSWIAKYSEEAGLFDCSSGEDDATAAVDDENNDDNNHIIGLNFDCYHDDKDTCASDDTCSYCTTEKDWVKKTFEPEGCFPVEISKINVGLGLYNCTSIKISKKDEQIAKDFVQSISPPTPPPLKSSSSSSSSSLKDEDLHCMENYQDEADCLSDGGATPPTCAWCKPKDLFSKYMNAVCSPKEVVDSIIMKFVFECELPKPQSWEQQSYPEDEPSRGQEDEVEDDEERGEGDEEEEEESDDMTNVQYNFIPGLTHSLTDEEVDPGFCDPQSPRSLSGYMDITGSKYDTTQDKHYFFWMFESRDSKTKSDADKANTPFIVWLTGGPGCSSTLALLLENGPCSVNKDGQGTTSNPHSWNSNSHVLWLDQPAGVGFSYGHKEDDSNEEMVGEDAYYFLQSFMKAHSEYSHNPLFIVGESYGGHYAPAIAHRIYVGNQEKKEGTMTLNLKGLGVGNGLTNPEIQYPYYADMAFKNSHNLPVVSESTYEKMKAAGPICSKLVHKCNEHHKFHPGPIEKLECNGAMMYCNMALMVPYQLTGLNPYDIRSPCEHPPLCYDMSYISNFMNLDSTRKALHVSDKSSKWESCNMIVHTHFMVDWMKDMSPLVADLVNGNVPVLIYAGDVDFICNYMGNRAWTLALEWNHKDEFNKADDHDWNNGKGLAKSSNGFTFLQVYDAGHMVPMDQPQVALDMINQFTSGQVF